MSTYSLRPGLEGQLDAEPDRDAARLAGALVGRLHHARAAAGDDREAGLGERRRRSPPPCAYAGSSALRAGGAEHRDRRTELGQRAEALDELALDPQHPPRVGVHPVGRAAGVQQPLVGGAGLHLARGASPVRPRYLLRDLGLRASARVMRRPPASRAAAARRSVICSSGTNSSCRCARCGSPGPKFTAGTPSAAEPGHVGPAELGVGRAADRLDERGRRGHREPGHRRRGGVAELDLEAVEDLAHVRVAPPRRTGRGRSGS